MTVGYIRKKSENPEMTGTCTANSFVTAGQIRKKAENPEKSGNEDKKESNFVTAGTSRKSQKHPENPEMTGT